MTILAIETSTSYGSVALLVDGRVKFDQRFSAERSHTASLFTMLELARGLVNEIDLVAVGLGPGSYAGVRIAISAAIGFQLGLGARIVGLPSVATLETDAPKYVAVGDARREAYYFTRVEEGCCVDGPRLVSDAALHGLLAEFGQWPLLVTHPLVLAPTAMLTVPSARRLGQLAAAGVGIVAEGTLEPLYLREPHITQPKARPAR